MIKSVYLHHLKRKTHGVTVAHQILVLFVGVRIPVGLHLNSLKFREFFCFKVVYRNLLFLKKIIESVYKF